MIRISGLAAGMLAVFCFSAMAEGIDDVKLINLWESQKAVCAEGDQKSPDTWIACGRSDAFAAVLAARGMCLDAGQDVWRVGNHATKPGDDHWRCRLTSS